MTNYSIETMHGDEICSGIQSLSAARETAQRHANRRSESVYIQSDDGTVEVEPQTISADELRKASGVADVGGGNAVEDCDALYDD